MTDAEASWCKIADYVEPHWRGAGLPAYGDWLLNEIVKRSHQLDRATTCYECDEDLTTICPKCNPAQTNLTASPVWGRWLLLRLAVSCFSPHRAQ